MNLQIATKKQSYAIHLTNKEGSMSGSIPDGGRQSRRETSGDVPLRAEMTSYDHRNSLLDTGPQDLQDNHSMSFTTKIQTCWDKPFSDAPFTFRMTSPISICPLSAAGCPGKSFFTLTIVEPSCSGVRLSSRQKLNPRPELFFNSFTSNVFSAKETLTYHFLQYAGHEKSVWCSYSRHGNACSPPHKVLPLYTQALSKRCLQVKEDKKPIMTSQSAGLP